MGTSVAEAGASRAADSSEWLWVLEVRLDGKWVLRNGPCASYEQAVWHVNDALKASNNWRIRGGPAVGRELRK